MEGPETGQGCAVAKESEQEAGAESSVLATQLSCLFQAESQANVASGSSSEVSRHIPNQSQGPHCLGLAGPGEGGGLRWGQAGVVLGGCCPGSCHLDILLLFLQPGH